MLVHDHVWAIRYLDGPVLILLHCSPLYEFSQDLSCILIVLGLLLSDI